jgi:hypothetical protein
MSIFIYPSPFNEMKVNGLVCKGKLAGIFHVDVPPGIGCALDAGIKIAHTGKCGTMAGLSRHVLIESHPQSP